MYVCIASCVEKVGHGFLSLEHALLVPSTSFIQRFHCILLSTMSLHAEYQEHPSGDDPLTEGEWVVTDIAAGSQLKTEHRVREKEAIAGNIDSIIWCLFLKRDCLNNEWCPLSYVQFMQPRSCHMSILSGWVGKWGSTVYTCTTIHVVVTLIHSVQPLMTGFKILDYIFWPWPPPPPF